MPKTEERKLWERQEGESAKAFAAFVVYRDLGDKRSLEKVSQNLAKSLPFIKSWSSKYNWVKRAAAYDDFLDAESTKKTLKKCKAVRETSISVAMKMLKLAVEGMQNVDPKKLSPRDIKEFTKTAAMLATMFSEQAEKVQAEQDSSDDEDVIIYLPDNGRLG